MAYKVYKDVYYPGWAEYEGDAENCPFSFTIPLPDQTDWFYGWYANKMISAAKQAVEEHGGHILRMTVWRNKAPTLVTRYRVLITAHSNPLPALAWVAIIPAIFAILILAISVLIGTIWVSKWDPKEVTKALKWGTYAIIGGGALSCVLAMILIAKPGKKEVTYA